MPDLHGLLFPRSIAIIGASSSPEKVGAIVLKNILDCRFSGAIFPINPKLPEVAGLKCYPDISSLPLTPDLVAIAIPAPLVNGELEKIGKAGVKNVVIFSAGFKESGSEGKSLEEELVSIANRYSLNIVGPNCLGFANNAQPLHITFGQIVRKKGNLRIVSQSGALATSLFDWCAQTDLGFDQFITVGNKSVLNENDFLEFWKNTEPDRGLDFTGLSDVSPIGLYLESISDGQKFLSIAESISPHNPIFVLKPGKSAGAARAMLSHTGAIAGSDAVLDAALEKAGVIRCRDLSEFFDLSKAFSWEDAPLGPRVAVISNAGGPAVLSTDSISEYGLELAQFSPKAQDLLTQNLPRMAGLHNPVDVLGDALADRFGEALDILLQEESVDSVLVILTPQLMTQIDKTAQIIGEMGNKHSKTILCSFIGGGLTESGEKILNSYKIPSFPFPERAIRTLSSMWKWRSWCQNHAVLDNPTAPSILPNPKRIEDILKFAKSQGHPTLDTFETYHLLLAAGIPTPDTKIVPSPFLASKSSGNSDWPVVLKISSPNLLHKSDVGGVITNITSQASYDDSVQKLQRIISQDSSLAGAQIVSQRQVGQGIEVIVGIKRDPNFGPVLLFGAGGRLAELISDRNLVILPIDSIDASALIKHSKVYKLLSGFRGDPSYDLTPLVDSILRLSSLLYKYPDIGEIEINPFIITHDYISAVDTKVILNK